MKMETILTQEYVGKYQGVWPNRTILDYLNDAIVKHPDKIAIIDKKVVLLTSSLVSWSIESHWVSCI